MRKKRSGRAPGRLSEPFRAIQGAHATEADPNESRVSIFEGLPFFYFFALWTGLGVAQTQKMEKVRTSETSLHLRGTRVGLEKTTGSERRAHPLQ